MAWGQPASPPAASNSAPAWLASLPSGPVADAGQGWGAGRSITSPPAPGCPLVTDRPAPIRTLRPQVLFLLYHYYEAKVGHSTHSTSHQPPATADASASPFVCGA